MDGETGESGLDDPIEYRIFGSSAELFYEYKNEYEDTYLDAKEGIPRLKEFTDKYNKKRL
jgi:hypothetical protein